jgi:Tol biopolymer transport system component
MGIRCTFFRLGGLRRTQATAGAVALLSLGLLVPQALFSAAAYGEQSTSRRDDLRGTHIVWSQFVAGTSTAHLVVSGPHGENPAVISHPPTGAQDIDPKVSPDGRSVTFERDFSDGTTGVELVRISGANEHQVSLGCTDPCAADLTPTWTPDGRHLVFTRVIGPFDQPNGSARSGVLWTADLHGDHLRRLSQPGIDGAFEDYNASFAPKGYIVFIRVRNSDIKSAAFRMNPDGTGIRRLTPWSIDADELSVSPARYGPTADLVVFETFGHGTPDGVAAAVGTVSAIKGPASVRLLTSPKALPVQHFNPGWAPNGKRIVYVRFAFDDATQTATGDIWTMVWDGRDRRPVSQSPLFEFRPNWGAAPHRGSS